MTSYVAPHLWGRYGRRRGLHSCRPPGRSSSQDTASPVIIAGYTAGNPTAMHHAGPEYGCLCAMSSRRMSATATCGHQPPCRLRPKTYVACVTTRSCRVDFRDGEGLPCRRLEGRKWWCRCLPVHAPTVWRYVSTDTHVPPSAPLLVSPLCDVDEHMACQGAE